MAGSGGDDAKYCNNCKREIAAINFVMHEVHCKRNIVLCSVCDEPVARSELEEHMNEEHTHCPECNKQVRPSELSSHLDKEHGSNRCPDCNLDVPNKEFEDHRKKECVQRKVACAICELELPVIDLAEHEQWCGSRTELCTLCERYIKLKDLDTHIATNCLYPEPEKKEKAPLNSEQDLAQRLKAYEFRREELNRALGLDGQWNRIPSTLRNDSEYMARFHPEQEDAVAAGNQMLRIEQMAEAMMSGEGYLDRYNRRREIFGASEEEPEDALTRARRRRRMNEEAAAAAAASDETGDAAGESTESASGRKPRSLDEIRKQRKARETDEDWDKPSRFLWVGGEEEKKEKPGESSNAHRFSRTGVALPGFNPPIDKEPKRRSKEKSPRPQSSGDVIKIPCEFCMNPFPLEELMNHQERCGPNSASGDAIPSDFFNDILRPSPTRNPAAAVAVEDSSRPPPTVIDALPCEFCEDLFPFDVLVQHQSNCDKNPSSSRPPSARNAALSKLNENLPGITSSQSNSFSSTTTTSLTSKAASFYGSSVSGRRSKPHSFSRSSPSKNGVGASSFGTSAGSDRHAGSSGPSGSGRGSHAGRRESRHRKSQEKEESIEDVMKAAKSSREKLLYTKGKILGKQSNIDLSGDTNARYHAKFPSAPRAKGGAAAAEGAASEGGAVAAGMLPPSAAYADEASDRYLSHRERMMTATRERMGDAAASSRSQDWASQIFDNLLEEDGQRSRVKRSGSREPAAQGNGAARSNGARAQGHKPYGYYSSK